jgi:hypothetical protein
VTQSPLDQPTGSLHLTIQGNVMTSSMITPSVSLNGTPVRVKYGENALPLPAGRWHIDVYCQWVRRFGQAAMEFDVAPGQTVPIYYAAPMHQFTTGAIGHEKQPRKGMVVFILAMTLVLGIALGLGALSVA